MDLRGHGKSSTENEIDMSIEVHIFNCSILENSFFFFKALKLGISIISSLFLVGTVTCALQTLCNDVQAVVKTMYGDTPPAIVLVGHRFVIHFKNLI